MENSITFADPARASESESSQDNFYTPANQAFYASNPYNDLDPSKQTIRLLEILPVNDDEPLRLRLLAPFSLLSDKPPSYCAISYFAGNHKETEIVYVNGIAFNAFLNLARALRQAATAQKRGDLAKYPPLIWADQVCINQSSPVERSHQVGFMRGIYESAEVVLASLGWIDPSAGRWTKAAKRLYLDETSQLELRGSVIYVNELAFADFYDEEFSKDWSALNQLLSSQWWQRGWVYQEIVCAQDVIVFFGNDILDWDIIAIAAQVFRSISGDFVRCFLKTGKPSFDASNFFSKIVSYESKFARFMIDSRIEWINQKKKEAIELFLHAQACSFTDPRDRIYAFIGLTDPGYKIMPDYQIDTASALRLACKRMILYKRRLDVLCYSISDSDVPSHQKRRDIPSWTPDWTSLTGKYKFIYDSVGDRPRFRASADYSSAATFHLYNMVPDSILRVQCIFFDQLCSRTTIDYQGIPDSFETLDKWARVAGLDSALGSVGSDHLRTKIYPFDDSITIFEAFWHVVLRGSFEVPNESLDSKSIEDIATRARETTDGGTLFQSRNGYLGVTRKNLVLDKDDLICIILGANVPFIVRKTSDYYVLVGDAYVEGLMRGEGVNSMQQGELVVETINIH